MDRIRAQVSGLLSREHRRSFMAFTAMGVLMLAVIVTGLRSEAVRGYIQSPGQLIADGQRLFLSPAEAEPVSGTVLEPTEAATQEADPAPYASGTSQAAAPASPQTPARSGHRDRDRGQRHDGVRQHGHPGKADDHAGGRDKGDGKQGHPGKAKGHGNGHGKQGHPGKAMGHDKAQGHSKQGHPGKAKGHPGKAKGHGKQGHPGKGHGKQGHPGKAKGHGKH